jgi:hypothetical protein
LDSASGFGPDGCGFKISLMKIPSGPFHNAL